ncbi:MAG: MarR family transcriptional regulator [Gammaproteobacteria bacterium]|nr:MAG: MarR family transcriptional regulator [Gammaproteobacteria bacterium]
MRESVFGFDQPEDSPGFLLWQTMVTWQRLIKKALDPYNISHAQFVILANVLWFERVNQKPTQILIVRSTKLDKMTVSKSLKKLVAEGLIKRREHETDTRAKSVYLTAKGKAMASKLVPMVEKIDEEFFGVISATHQRSLVNILADLVSKIEKRK